MVLNTQVDVRLSFDNELEEVKSDDENLRRPHRALYFENTRETVS